jgi:hypothetical protein
MFSRASRSVRPEMDKEIASALIALATATDEPIGKMTELIEQIEDGETKDRFKKALGDFMGAIFLDIIRPIETLYPDLNPDK